MALQLFKIASTTVGSGGAANVQFTSIPQGYTDLMVVASIRSAYTGGLVDTIVMDFNTNNTSTGRTLYGETTGVGSFLSGNRVGFSPSSTSTANTFSNMTIYIPDYTSSNNKSFSADSVTEGNATTYQSGVQSFTSGLWSITTAINQIGLYTLGASNNLSQHSTFTLYGIL